MKSHSLLKVKVKESEMPASDVRELSLVSPDGAKLPEFTPGAHVLVHHPNGLQRQYSLIGPPSDRSRYRIAIRRLQDGRGGSRAFHDELEVGDELLISEPVNGMTIDTTAEHHVFIAGGIGVTPVLGLLHALPDGADAEVHYCFRSLETAPYLDTLKSLGARVVTYDESAGELLNVDALLSAVPQSSTIYHCGPAGLMAAVEAAASDRRPDKVRSESFGGQVAPEGTELGEPFEVELDYSGKKVVQVGRYETMLRALLRENITVDYSCEVGECGTCILEYTSGHVEHHDTVLENDERGEMMTPCVSRARGRIVVDL
uniref:Oxidoreductase n=1 Tax=Rhodococcus sp. NS1 TaxID=402236 RepID=A0A097SQQ5_9NOCA|nr:hypothetical protein LRS1606.432 [Rhodococcus sp. NS1]